MSRSWHWIATMEDLWFIAGTMLHVLPAQTSGEVSLIFSQGSRLGITQVNDLMVDRSGSVWLGGYDDRVICYDPIANPSATTRINIRISPVFGAPIGKFLSRIWMARSGSCTNYRCDSIGPQSGKMTELTYDRDDRKVCPPIRSPMSFCDRTGILWVATWGRD